MFILQWCLVSSLVWFSCASQYEEAPVILTTRGRSRQENKQKTISTRANNNNIKWGTYKAKVDNFDSNNRDTFDMRYLSNLDYETENGPIVIYLGGEWTIIPGTLVSGQIVDIARENKGALFYTEHRYFGESIPVEDFTTENLKYLETSQAIEDIKHFILHLKKQQKYKKSKVVLCGCSYSASLAAWTKLTYPKLITATYSTSGPMLALANMNEFLERVTIVLDAINPDCTASIKNAIEGLEDLYDSSADGAKKVQNMLGICNPQNPNEPLDKQAIFQQIASEFGGLVQSSPDKVSAECKKIEKSEGTTDMEKFANYRKGGRDGCFNGDFAYVMRTYGNTTIKGGFARPFFYMQCNEFGWFITTDSANQAFGQTATTDYYFNLCRGSFGETYTDDKILQSIDDTNAKYGGRKPDVHHSVFVYNALDPWAIVGLYEAPNDDSAVLTTVSGDHCTDMFAEKPSEEETMLAAKQKTRSLIKSWLAINNN